MAKVLSCYQLQSYLLPSKCDHWQQLTIVILSFSFQECPLRDTVQVLNCWNCLLSLDIWDIPKSLCAFIGHRILFPNMIFLAGSTTIFAYPFTHQKQLMYFRFGQLWMGPLYIFMQRFMCEFKVSFPSLNMELWVCGNTQKIYPSKKNGKFSFFRFPVIMYESCNCFIFF